MDPSNNLYICMVALFLVAFFSLLRISNLVPCMLNEISKNNLIFLQRSSIRFPPRAALSFVVTRTETLQFKQRLLEIPLPIIPGSHIPFQPFAIISAAFLLNPTLRFSVYTLFFFFIRTFFIRTFRLELTKILRTY